MATQIAVRLPDELVGFVDEQVAAGEVPSRAALIGRLLEREMRRRQALKDLERMRAAGATGYPDLADVAASASRRPIDLD